MYIFFRCVILVGSCLAVGGCDPIVEVFGSFFPAWLICLFGGVTLAILTRELFARVRIEPHLGPLFIVYPSLGLLFTLIMWLVFYRS
jgi:hypothetical protein